MAQKSRAEYFKKRREKLKYFNVALPKEKVEAIEERLNEMGVTKTAWISEKIDEELKK
jgi:hypothetical protein